MESGIVGRNTHKSLHNPGGTVQLTYEVNLLPLNPVQCLKGLKRLKQRNNQRRRWKLLSGKKRT